MTYFAGFDSAFYPGDEKMRSMFDDTNLYWCGFYLGSAEWSSHFGTLQEIGWGVAPIYTGKQPGSSAKLHNLKAAHAKDPAALQRALTDNGAADGNEAVAQARKSHIPTSTYLYFDVENTVPDLDWLTYYRGWSAAVAAQYFGVGLYTRAAHASWVWTKLVAAPGFDIILPLVWIAKYTHANPNGAKIPERDFLQTPFPTPNPADAGGGASSWQHIGNCGMKWSHSKGAGKQLRYNPVDYNSSIFPDPGLGVLSLVQQ